MPNKYEREIEEILRNLDQSAPKPRLSQRLRRKSDVRARGQRGPKPALPSFNFGLSEWCLIIAWVAALIAGGWAYAHRSFFDPTGADLITGSIALVSLICLFMVVILAFSPQSRSPSQQARYGNVTPMRRNPLSSLSTRWNLFLLKLRYRRRKDQ
jgi:hypothetical protein